MDSPAGVASLSEGTKGSGLSSMGLLRPAPGGRRGLARARARREGGATSKARE